MSVSSHERVRTGARATLARAWDVAGTPARVLIVAWAVLPLVIAIGLTRLPWNAPGMAFTEVDSGWVLAHPGRALDDDAKADVGTLGALMEDCFARTNDFTACDTPAELPRAVAAGIEFGTGPNRVEIVGASADAYELIGVSQTGARFGLARDADGSLRHTCPHRGIGGCSPHGTW